MALARLADMSAAIPNRLDALLARQRHNMIVEPLFVIALALAMVLAILWISFSSNSLHCSVQRTAREDPLAYMLMRQGTTSEVFSGGVI